MSGARALRGRQLWIPALIFAAVAGPFVLAILIYVRPQWFAFGHVNHGQLVQPPVKIRPAPLRRAFAATPLPADYFRGRWTLVYVGGPHCGRECVRALYVTRQIRLGLADAIDQVQRLYVVRGRPEAPAFLRRVHPDLTVAEATGGRGEAFAAQFTATTTVPSIYLVAPEGYLMLTYPVARDPQGLLDDVRHVLGLDFQ